MIRVVPRSATTADVFTAVAETRRREILDALIGGEKPVGAIVAELSMSHAQVSTPRRVLSEVGLVRCRADGRRRLYRLEPARLQPFQQWLARYDQVVSDRLDRGEDYLPQPQQPRQPPRPTTKN